VDKVHFEYLGEDQTFEGAKVWKVEAIHVTTTRNKRKFTQTELAASGRSLSFRPLNINHDRNQALSFPENATLAMNFNPATMAVEGSFRIIDPTINALIETGRIKQVSIEQIPTAGETCNAILCEQHGVAFIGMALLESDVTPGDPMANIKLESLLISDAQRECHECTDNTPCTICASNHNNNEFDEIMEHCLQAKAQEHPEMRMDMRVMSCLEELNRVNSPSFKGITIQLNEKMNHIESNITKGDTVIEAISKEELKPEMAHYFYSVATEKHNAD